jgi:hypothetical protein
MNGIKEGTGLPVGWTEQVRESMIIGTPLRRRRRKRKALLEVLGQISLVSTSSARFLEETLLIIAAPVFQDTADSQPSMASYGSYTCETTSSYTNLPPMTGATTAYHTDTRRVEGTSEGGLAQHLTPLNTAQTSYGDNRYISGHETSDSLEGLDERRISACWEILSDN